MFISLPLYIHWLMDSLIFFQLTLQVRYSFNRPRSEELGRVHMQKLFANTAFERNALASRISRGEERERESERGRDGETEKSQHHPRGRWMVKHKENRTLSWKWKETHTSRNWLLQEVAELKQTTPIPCSSIFFHFNWFTRSGVLFSFHRCQAIFASFEWNKVN